MESFTSQVHSGYGCLNVMGRVLNATESWCVHQSVYLSICLSIYLTIYVCMYVSIYLSVYQFSFRWQLDTQEIILLSLFPSSLPSSQCTDIPVYLPKASNTIAHRLLIFQLVQGVDLMVMCDSEPSLAEAQEMVRTFWTPIKDRFSGLSLQVPRLVLLLYLFIPRGIGIKLGLRGLIWTYTSTLLSMQSLCI